MPAHPPTASSGDAVQGDNLFLQQQLQQGTGVAPTQPKRRNTGGGRRGKQAAQLSVTITKQGGASVTFTQNADGSVHEGASRLQHASGSDSLSPRSTGSSFVVSSSNSISVDSRNGGMVYTSSALSQGTSSSFAATRFSPGSFTQFNPLVHAGASNVYSIGDSLHKRVKQHASISDAAARIPTTPTDNLPSQPFLKSLASLPSLSLGSTGLPNLPSIPNLPSLPNAIAALQLSGAEVPDVASLSREDATGLESQLSPHGRDSDEKSLPLKKRKIFDSSSMASPTTVTRPSFTSSLPLSPMVMGPSTTALMASPVPMQQERSVEAVVSPGPTPVHLLTQVLPPAVSMQLLNEINTAITPDEDGDLPLHIAVVHENEAMVRKLIQLMALASRKVDRFNKQQQTPLHLAIKLAYLPAIQMLLEAGANPNLVDSSGSTSIHMAVQGRDIDCLEALLQWSKFPLDLNYRNFEGLAPLHTAVINNDLEIVKTLLDHSADINIMDGKSGRTVLFHAAEGNQRAAVELLLRRGADPEIANYAGVSPSMAAQGRSHTFVSRLLMRAADEGLEDMVVANDGAEDMDVNSPAALEVVVSDESSDSSRVSVADKTRNSMAVTPQRPAMVRSVSQSQPQPVSMATSQAVAFSRQDSQGPNFTVSADSGNNVNARIVTCSVTTTSAVQPVLSGTRARNRQPLPMSISPDSTSVELSRTEAEPGTSNAALTNSAASVNATQAAIQQKMAQLLVQNLLLRAVAEQKREDPQAGTNLNPLLHATTSIVNSTGGSMQKGVNLQLSFSSTSPVSSGSNLATRAQSPSVGIMRISNPNVSAAGNPASSVPSSSLGIVRFQSSNTSAAASLDATPPPVLNSSVGIVRHQNPNTSVSSPVMSISSSSIGMVRIPQTNVSGATSMAGSVVSTSMGIVCIPDSNVARLMSLPAGSANVATVPSLPSPSMAAYMNSSSGASSLMNSIPSSSAGLMRMANIGPRVHSATSTVNSTVGTISSTGDCMHRGANVARLMSLPAGITTVASVPSLPPSLSAYTNSGSSGETNPTSSPAPAHSQPTRPLLLFRSSSVDPGSADGRRMGSMELRHVTADALLALQRSSTNSVNAANQHLRDPNLRSAPPDFEKLRAFLATSQASGIMSGNIPMDISSSPPLANHVSADSRQQIRTFYDPTDSGDEPKDLSLKSLKASQVKTEPGVSPRQFVPDTRTVNRSGFEASVGKGFFPPGTKVFLPSPTHMNSVLPQAQQNQSTMNADAPKLKAKRTRNTKPRAPKEKAGTKGKAGSAVNLEKTVKEEKYTPVGKGKGPAVGEEMTLPLGMPAVLESTRLALQVKISQGNEQKPSPAFLSMPNIEEMQNPASASDSPTQGMKLPMDKGQTAHSVTVSQVQQSIRRAAASVTGQNKIVPPFTCVPVQGMRLPVTVKKAASPSLEDARPDVKDITPETVSPMTSVAPMKTMPPVSVSPYSKQMTLKRVVEEDTMPVLKAEVNLPLLKERTESGAVMNEECPVLDSEASMDGPAPPSPDSPALVIDTGEGSPTSAGDSQSEQPMETG